MALSDIMCAVITRETFERVLGPLQDFEHDQQRRRAEAENHWQMLEAQGLAHAELRSGSRRSSTAPARAAPCCSRRTTTKWPYTLRLESKAELERSGVEAVAGEVELLKKMWEAEHDIGHQRLSTSSLLPGLLHTFQTDGLPACCSTRGSPARSPSSRRSGRACRSATAWG